MAANVADLGSAQRTLFLLGEGGGLRLGVELEVGWALISKHES